MGCAHRAPQGSTQRGERSHLKSCLRAAWPRHRRRKHRRDSVFMGYPDRRAHRFIHRAYRFCGGPLRFRSDGYSLASAGAEGVVLLWDVSHHLQELHATLPAPTQHDFGGMQATALLPNYPNPFNPETWLPYQLAKPAAVTVHIHAATGTLIRTLSLGYQPAGRYQQRHRAAYWDGKKRSGRAGSEWRVFLYAHRRRVHRHAENAY